MNEFDASYFSVFSNNYPTNQSFYKYVEVRPASIGKEIACGSVATSAVGMTITAVDCAKRVISSKVVSAPSIHWASHLVSELRAGRDPLPFTREPPSTETGMYRTIFAMEVGVILRL